MGGEPPGGQSVERRLRERGGARKRTRADRICRAYGRGARVSNSAPIRRDGCDAVDRTLMNIPPPDVTIHHVFLEEDGHVSVVTRRPAGG